MVKSDSVVLRVRNVEVYHDIQAQTVVLLVTKASSALNHKKKNGGGGMNLIEIGIGKVSGDC